MVNRRAVVRGAVGAGALACVGDLSFLGTLPPVSAEEAKLPAGAVRLRPEIEPLVRLLEETPREQLLERAAERIRGGTTYTQLLAALMLAGVRNIKPRPVGFKFHAVMVVNSAHLASQASSEQDRWLPLFWALDSFKSSQAQDVKEGDWTMAALDEAALPAADKARDAFIHAMDRWDEAAADVAVARLARETKPAELYELFWRYGARDFRDIGHKAIYTANSWRTLGAIGWEHAEPVVRSLAFALLQRGNTNPADGDDPVDRPWRRNLERVKGIGEAWKIGKPDPSATTALLEALRTGSPEDACGLVASRLKDGVSPDTLWDAVMASAGEMLMRKPGILGIHCVTSANALRHAAGATSSDETRLMLLLQGAAFMTLFQDALGRPAGAGLDRLEPSDAKETGPAAVEAVFDAVSRDRSDAARRTLAYLKAGGSPQELMQAARRLIFLKGTNAHDYKFSAAALEDYGRIAPGWRDRCLAAAMFNLRGSGDADNPLVQRTRTALKG